MGIPASDLPYELKQRLGLLPPDKPQRAKRGTGKVGKRKAEIAKLRQQADFGPGYCDVVIPIRVQTESNTSGHWRRKNTRAAFQSGAVNLFLRKPGMLPPLPVVVQFTRYGVGTMDTDNLVSAFKHVRDAVASLYGCGDSPKDPITWAEPKQEVAGEYAIRIRIDSEASR